jgi:hypothetical protein
MTAALQFKVIKFKEHYLLIQTPQFPDGALFHRAGKKREY